MNSRAFQTADASLAAYLYASSYPLMEVRFCQKRPLFQFPAEAAVGAEAFYEGACVPAKNVLHAIRQLQSWTRENAE
jgi:hypothetical protein